MIPSMGGREIGSDLRKWSAGVPLGIPCVELGVWLGAGTKNIALGLNDSGNSSIIHCYDKFQANKTEVLRAYFGSVKLEENQDTLPVVKQNLYKISKNIIYHKGNILIQTWTGEKIGLFVDDMCKRSIKFDFAVKTFFPYFIPNVTIVVLMDFLWYKRHLREPDALCQPQFIDKNKKCFKEIKRWDGLCCVAFKYLGGLEI